MALKLNTLLQNTLVQAFADLFDVGVDTINLYGGAEPATANTALSGQPLLAGVTLPAPGFGTASGGSVGKVGTWEDLSIDASGTVAFFRLTNDAGEVLQGSVTATGGGGDLEIDNINFVQRGTFPSPAFLSPCLPTRNVESRLAAEQW